METVSFKSGELTLSGILHLPEGRLGSAGSPAFIYCHGFGGHKDGPQQVWAAHQFAAWGYAVLRFDFRGCGDSEGRRGWVLPLEQVEDAKAAVSYLASRREIDPARIGIIGSSYGAAVAVYTAGTDDRIAGVIAQGGWGDGLKRTKTQHPTPDAWEKFSAMLEAGKKTRAETGKTPMLHRFDIVPVPEHLRVNIDRRSIFEFPLDTPLETMKFRPAEKIGNIAPRPVLLIHAATDHVTPPAGSLELYARAKPPTELHLMTDVDHFMFGEDNPRVIDLIGGWLRRYLPV